MLTRWFSLFVLLSLPSLRAEVEVGPLFRDHLVLQRDQPITVWGVAAPGEGVRVTFEPHSVATTAGGDGRWRLQLPGRKASRSPQELVVEGTNRIVIRDVLVGDVWLCAGQSNMQMSVQHASHAEDEIAAAAHPLIREFKVAAQFATEPRDTVAGQWQVCSPTTVGSFSATAYFFARDLHRELDVPIGLVTSAYGNSPIASWRDATALAAEPVVTQWWSRQLAASPPPRPHRQPSVCFNGMIHPLIPFSLRGVLWYQGESDASETPHLASLYARQFQGLIGEWRRHFGRELPFFWVQLAGFGKSGARDWVGVRAAQSTALALPRTGQAIAIDVGDAANIHPKNKQAVGARLARLALNREYGIAREDSGPVLVRSQRSSEGTVQLHFRPAEELSSQGDLAAAFELAEADGRFQPVSLATVSGQTVTLRAPGLRLPVAVRYAWMPLPTGALFNRAGLPAAPFQADLSATPEAGR
ncbi:MAG TPA: sialate O-acetylesterase [Opitutaceae bacterium]|nr:sialate O-acetylesterase [Opitutaceae bacterium]HRE06952.1 sialate O-acetylesterase [Opitutaceae bacterium]